MATYAFPFPILAAADLAAFVNDVQISAFTVSGVGQTNGGSITLTTPPQNGQTVTILRKRPYERITDFAEAGQFRAKTVNDELDSQEMQTQQVVEEIGRSLRIAPTAEGDIEAFEMQQLRQVTGSAEPTSPTPAVPARPVSAEDSAPRGRCIGRPTRRPASPA